MDNDLKKYENEVWKLLEESIKNKPIEKEEPSQKKETDIERWSRIQRQDEREYDNAIDNINSKIQELCKKEDNIDSESKTNFYISIINACYSKISSLKGYQSNSLHCFEEFEAITKQIINTYDLSIEYINKLLNIQKEDQKIAKEKRDLLHLLIAEYYYLCQGSIQQMTRDVDSMESQKEDALLCSINYGKKVIDMLPKIENPIERPMTNIHNNFNSISYFPGVKTLSELKNKYAIELSDDSYGIVKTNISNDKILDKKVSLKTGDEIILFNGDVVQALKYECTIETVRALSKLGKTKDAKKLFNEAKLISKGYTDINDTKSFNDFAKWFKHKGCFVATAVYNSPHSNEVIFLRKWRDKHLVSNSLGIVLIDFYYYISPLFAKWIKKNIFLKKIVKTGLDIFIKILRNT
ncbi:MAG: CFI-box-CTERM domain-containing protein [Elusimicrobiota bacterium]|nr:CFI-box-CTERM domain-containing protein [Elusimicrobiota bacterium]